MQPNEPPVLEVSGLSIAFEQYTRGLRRQNLQAVTDMDITVRAGELVAIVGASGSGKSLLAHAIMGILPYNARMRGEMRYRGETLTQARREALRGREIVLVPQSVGYLDPLMRVGAQVRNGRATKAQSRAALARYGLDAPVDRMYPHMLSGGMARRVLIATAAMAKPSLVIADEPTPGLHSEVAHRVVSHFRELADGGAGVLLITHDLRLAAETCDRVVVFLAGTTVEDAAAADFAHEETLRHPYTRALWRAMPEHGFAVPSAPTGITPGCPYASQCPQATRACADEVALRAVRGGRVRCNLYKEGEGAHGA